MRLSGTEDRLEGSRQLVTHIRVLFCSTCAAFLHFIHLYILLCILHFCQSFQTERSNTAGFDGLARPTPRSVPEKEVTLREILASDPTSTPFLTRGVISGARRDIVQILRVSRRRRAPVPHSRAIFVRVHTRRGGAVHTRGTRIFAPPFLPLA